MFLLKIRTGKKYISDPTKILKQALAKKIRFKSSISNLDYVNISIMTHQNKEIRFF